MTLYKYRSLNNFERFADIILNKRLYAACYQDLNDPMEGFFYYEAEQSKDGLAAIMNEMNELRIVSLSRRSDHPLMWAHYADGGRGVAIGVKPYARTTKVDYVGPPQLFDGINHTSGQVVAKIILSKKYQAWKYEEEERILVDNRGSFVNVEIKEVIFGNRIDDNRKCLIKKLIAAVDPDIQCHESKVITSWP